MIFRSKVRFSFVYKTEYLKKELKLRCISYAVFIGTEEKQIKDRMKLRGEETAETNTEAKEEVLSMLRTFTV